MDKPKFDIEKIPALREMWRESCKDKGYGLSSVLWIPYVEDGEDTGYDGGSNGHIRSRHFIKPRELKETTINTGYRQVKLRIKGKYKNMLVQRIIYQCFNGDLTDEDVIDHWDDCKTNNIPDNLRKEDHYTNNPDNKKKRIAGMSKLEVLKKKSELREKRLEQEYGDPAPF